MYASNEPEMILPLSAVRAAPPAVRAWIIGLWDLGAPAAEVSSVTSASSTQLGLARLSDTQAREFLSLPMKPATRDLLKAAVELGPRFRWADLAIKVRCPVDNDQPVRGAFTGLLKRTRSVTNDPKAWLFAWPGWDDLEWEDAVGEMNPETHAAFRRAFGMSSPVTAD